MSVKTGLACAGVILSAASGGGCEKKGAPGSVSPFDTPAWHEDWEQEPHMLLTRGSSKESDVLLLRSLNYAQALAWDRGTHDVGRDSVIYRYTPGETELEPVGIDAWDKATGNICDSSGNCRSGVAQILLYGPFRFDLPNHVVRYRGEVVRTLGRTVLSVRQSPKGHLVAVLSAAGEYRKGLIPFMGGARVSGPRYHQVFKHSDASPVGKPVVLRGTSNDDDVRPVWSADERYVIYHDTFFTHLWIVPVPRNESEKAGGK